MNIKRIKIISIISISLCCVITDASDRVVKPATNSAKKVTKSVTHCVATQTKAPAKTSSSVQKNSSVRSTVTSKAQTQTTATRSVSVDPNLTDARDVVEPTHISADLVQEEKNAPVVEKKIKKPTSQGAAKKPASSGKPTNEVKTTETAPQTAKPAKNNVPASKPAPKKPVGKAPKVHLDGIKTVVFGKESTNIITTSDLIRPGLDGSLRTLDELELEALMYQDATAKKMLPDEDAIDRHLNTVRKENNDMSLDQLKQVFKSAGYTYTEGREQFKIMTAVNSILDFMIRSRLLVPEKEVRAYYDANPVYEDETYRVERVFVPFSASMSSDELYNQLVSYAQTGTQPSCLVEWASSFWVNVNDLAQDKKFITQLAADQISQPVEISGGFELFRLKEKREHRVQPLEERYTEIATTLRKPRYEKLFEEYKTSLFGASSIVRFNVPLNSSSF